MSKTKQEELVEQFSDQFQAVLQEEKQLIKEGKVQEVLLMKLILNFISVEEFVTVASSRGKKWQFLAALSDALVEIEATGLIQLSTMMVSQNLNEAVLKHAIEAVNRIKTIAGGSEDDPDIAALVTQAKRNVAEAQRLAINGYYERTNKRWRS